MSVLIKGLNIMPCKDGFDGKGLVIIGYDDKLYAVAHEQIIPLPDHGDLIDREVALYKANRAITIQDAIDAILDAPTVIPAERSEDEVVR